MITLRCEIKDGGDTQWEYEWNTTSSNKLPEQSEYRISYAFPSHSGTYRCRGRTNNTKHSSTDWSEPITLTVSDKPQPVLTVSPSWLSPGDSVTLNCEVEHPSAGWRFYWYKAVPKQSGFSYSYVLLPDSLNGSEQDSYVIHGQTRTAGYVCTAKRGKRWYFARYSEPKFVWSADFHSSAPVTVSPNSVQHFTYKSVSLNCEGNSSEWRMRTFSKDSQQKSLPCSYWGTVTGSTCNLYSYGQRAAVYWCESGSGEFSSAVNVTLQNEDIILVSPVHPVPEGGSVSLSCKLRRETLVSNVFFYRNDELIQNDTRGELNISAVSKSDEGFYSCQHSQQVSAQSWMSVTAVSRPERSSSPVPLIVGLVFGLLILLLLLLYRYRLSKGK
ncbi:B-cell receptor CD22-like [Pempheris klunzingeri]|uniref:B-cell receptor CD22-like n=1 Tax=Pempheris klunzingeri TaxID=3127111 RepID=UPI0039815A16